MSIARATCLAIASVMLLAACSRHAATPPSSTAAPNSVAASASRAAPAQLVVLIVIDQLGSWVLERHWDRLDAGGLLRNAAARGA
jgi:predicted AlkP superfamily pyrophosphatase or phosphodiesterase